MTYIKKIPDTAESYRKVYLLLLLGLIGTYLFLLTANIVSSGNSGLSKLIWNLGHIPFYGVTTILLFLCIGNSANGNRRFYRSIMPTTAIALSFALLDEFSQVFVSGRMASLLDLSLDVIGILCALFLIYYYRFVKFADIAS